MGRITAIFVWLVLSATLQAQNIPAGTALPVMLNSTLDARKDKPGQEISARLMQDVLLPEGQRIPAGSKVVGHIVEVSRSARGSGSRVVIKFERIVVHGHSIPMVASVRAIASMMDVFEAKLPTNALDDYGTSESDWNTIQVGGEGVFRGSGEVVAADRVVGATNDAGDVTAKLAAVPDRGCRGSVDGNEREQALWVFSTSACGIYGFGELTIVHAGRSNPVGEIALASRGNVHVPSGSGLLLRVQQSGSSQKS
jgi:hypothetical protein